MVKNKDINFHENRLLPQLKCCLIGKFKPDFNSILNYEPYKHDFISNGYLKACYFKIWC